MFVWLQHVLPEISRNVSEGYKVWIALAAMGLALGWHRLDRRTARQLLVGLTLVAGLNYARWGVRTAFEKVDAYDVIHYYLNAKYFDELGYYDLYPACIYADRANGGPYFKREGPRYMAQDDDGHHFAPISDAITRGHELSQTRFTPERWLAFEHDFLYLQREHRGLSSKLWHQMILDHGFNGTPSWVLLAKPFTVVPVEYIKWLGYLDVGLLAVALAAVSWAYGGLSALWAALFFFVSYSGRWPTLSWVFLRYDWLASLLIAMSLLKKGKMAAGGVFAGFAASSRMFPALWMWGPFVQGVAGLIRKQVSRPLLLLALGFFVAVGVVEGASVFAFGADTKITHFDNMLDHNSAEQLSSRRVGLALALPFRGELLPKFIEPERKQLVKRQKPLRYGLAILVMLGLGWGMRRSRPDEAYAYGFVPFFLLTTASYYYYMARITLAVVHGAELDRARNRVGLGALFGIELFCNWAETTHPGHRVFLIGWLAWLLAAYSVLMTLWWLARPVPQLGDVTVGGESAVG